jgi:hypothetical protein
LNNAFLHIPLEKSLIGGIVVSPNRDIADRMKKSRERFQFRVQSKVISIGIFWCLPYTFINFPVFFTVQMHSLVTASTKRYQIGFDTIAQSAPLLNLMDLKIFHAPARLASPPISL